MQLKIESPVLNKRIQTLESSATVLIMDKAKKMINEGHDVVDLGGGEPDFDSPKMVVNQAIESLKNGETHYVNSKGVLGLREAISRKLKLENGIEADPEDGIIITPGGKQALFLSLFTFINEGDEVLLFDPSWVSYESIVKIAGGIPVRVPLDFESNYTITKENVESHISSRTKAMIMNSTNNPTGRVLKGEEIKILEDISLQNKLLIISDEIYEKIIYDQNKNISIGSVEKIKDQVITINGFSKSYAMTGWRLGYLAAAPHLVKEMLKLHQHTITSVNSFSQIGATIAFDCHDEVEHMRKAYEEKRNYIVNALNTIDGIKCKMPEGAFYAMPQITYKGMNSFELADYILNEGKVAVTPGEAFGSGSAQCVRLSFATSMENLEKAVSRFERLFNK